MEFKALYYSEKLELINPTGTIGVVTLWSPVGSIRRNLQLGGVNLTESTSPIAVIGNLRGNGFKYMLRNLLYNPQIDTLLVVGNDLAGSFEYIDNFFAKGLEPVSSSIEYLPSEEYNVDEVNTVRIIGTNFIIDDLARPSNFDRPPLVVRFEGVGEQLTEKVSEFLRRYNPTPYPPGGERVDIPIPETKITNYPSNPRSHSIIEDTPSEAWKSLVHRVFRYGESVEIKKGERRELQNVKVVIEKPSFEDDETIKECGLTPAELRQYQAAILSPENEDGFSYTYGSRIREYFGFDTLKKIVSNLKEGLDDRSSFMSLWDTRNDMEQGSRPCMVNFFFRKIAKKLHMTATFRTHNVADAWLMNLYGLMAIQQYVAKRTNTEVGAITVLSLSISISPDSLEKTQIIYDNVSSQARKKRNDPIGYFVISLADSEMVLHHLSYDGGVLLQEYKGRTPLQIQNELVRDIGALDIGHAIYLGRQIEKAYRCLKKGLTYEQDT